MKKQFGNIITFGLIMLSLLFITACSSSNNSSSSNESSSSNNTSTEQNKEQKETNKPSEPVKSIELSFGHFGGTDNSQHLNTITPFTEKVEELTEGRVTFEIYPGAALAPPPETYNSVVNGIMDAGWGINGYNPGRWPLHTVINLPFVAQGDAVKVSKVAQQLYEKFPEIQAEYEEVKPLWFWGTDEYLIVTKGKPVRTFEDIKGLKLRSPNPEVGRLIEAWGATPVSMPIPEMYDALQKGVVDGSISSIVSISDFQLYDVIDYGTHGFFSNNLMYSVLNMDSWNKLSAEDQQIIEDLISDGRMAELAGQTFHNELEETKKKSIEEGIEFITLPDEELAKFQEAATGIIDDWINENEAKGFPAQEIYDTATELFAQ